MPTDLPIEPEDVTALREHVQTMEGGAPWIDELADETLAAFIADAKARIGGRRWSWKVVAHERLRESYDGPSVVLDA